MKWFIDKFKEVDINIVPADIIVSIKLYKRATTHVYSLNRTCQSLKSSQLRTIIIDNNNLIRVNSLKVFNVFEDHGCFRKLMDY